MFKIARYYKSKSLFYFFISIIIFCFFLALLNLNDQYQPGDLYTKSINAYAVSLNILEGRDIFLSFASDHKEFSPFPAYEVIVGYFSKFTNIDLYYSGRLANFVIFILILITLIKFNNILKNRILTFFLIYILVVNQFFSLVLFSFHPELFDYLLITLSIYYFYKSKFVSCYIFMFFLAIIKAPYAFALMSFFVIEYYFKNKLYKDKIITIIKNEKIKILFLLFLIFPVISTDIIRNIIRGDGPYALSYEAKLNFFDYGLFQIILYDRFNAFKIYSFNFFMYKNIFFILLPIIALWQKNNKLFWKTIILYSVFFVNYFLFLRMYFVHYYSFLGLAFVFFIILIVNYKDVFIELINNLKKNIKVGLLFLFFPFFIFKIFTLHHYIIENNSENKIFTYVKKFLSKEKKMLVINDPTHLKARVGYAIIDRVHDTMDSKDLRNNCKEYMDKYDAILLVFNHSCFVDLLLSSGEVYVDKKKLGIALLWVNNLRLQKPDINSFIHINNFYRDDVNFDISKAKAEINKKIYENNNTTIYQNGNKLLIVATNCLSEGIVDKNLAIYLYYDLFGKIKYLFNKPENRHYNQYIKIVSSGRYNYGINYITDSIIINDTCYAIKEIKYYENVKKFEFWEYDFFD